MAVNIENTGSVDQGTAAPKSQAQAQPSSRSSFGFTGANSTLYDNGFQRARSQESVTKLQAAVKKIIDIHAEMGSSVAKNSEVFALERSLGLNVAAVVYAFKGSQQGQHVACVYPMLIERTADPLPPRPVNEDGNPFTIIRTISEYYDRDFWEIMVKQAKKILGEQYEIIDGTGLVVPVETPEDGDAYTSMVQGLVWNASNACSTRVIERLGIQTPPFSVSGSANAKERVEATVYLQPGQASSLTGRRIRQDVCIQMTASATDNRNALHGASTGVVTVGGYVDLVLKPQAPQYMPIPGQPYIPPTYYFPRFVITNNISEMAGESLEHQLLGIYLATMLSKDQLWKRTLLPNPTSGFDPFDFGAIGYEVNLTNNPKAKPEKINLKSNDVGLDEFYTLVNRVIDQDLRFSIHLSEFDDRTWLHDAFLILCSGNEADRTAAREKIINAANNLTQGRFSNHFGNSDRIIYSENNRIYQSYFVDANGEITDGRALDSMLPMLNYHGAKNPDTVNDWAATHDMAQVSLERRLADRYRILKGTMSSYNVTGKMSLGTFFPKFLEALSASIREAGLYIQPNNTQFDTGARVRGNSALADFGFSITHDTDGFRATQNPYSAAANAAYNGRYR